jgi:hypothetical protein
MISAALTGRHTRILMGAAVRADVLQTGAGMTATRQNPGPDRPENDETDVGAVRVGCGEHEPDDDNEAVALSTARRLRAHEPSQRNPPRR